MAKTLMLQIPTEVVRNSNYKIDDKSFTVYTYLLYKKFQNYGQDELDIVVSELKEITCITDNRTIKKVIEHLVHNKLIECKVKRLSDYKPLTVKLITATNEKYFTQLPINIIHKIDQIGTIGLRLLYYYESFINRTNTKSLFCFASYQTIVDSIGLSPHTISKYNSLLSDLKLLKITKHKTNYDVYSDGGLERFNNHYEVMIGRM